MRSNFNQCRTTFSWCDSGAHRGPIELDRIIEWRFLTDHHPAAHETLFQRDMLQVFQHMGFASTEVTGNEHARSLLSSSRRFLGGLELGAKLFFNCNLFTTQRLHRITTGHTRTERFNRSATTDLIAHCVASCAGRPPDSVLDERRSS